ncbi:MAG TPA: PaaI family thioesterase [Casimicrobiaceae bacterium]|nr:PaaI family thioesterase [Casimicrobiaceae bacterium]
MIAGASTDRIADLSIESVLAAIVDMAGGYAGCVLFPREASILTVEFKLNLLAPAEGERIVAEGFVVKSGRTLTITRGDVHAHRDGKRTLVALMQQTLMTMHESPDAPSAS